MMKKLTQVFFLSFTLLFLSSAVNLFASSQLEVKSQSTGPPVERDDEQRKWNSHIDNQAYLNNKARQRYNQLNSSAGSSQTIIINRDTNSRDCYYGNCRSWGVRYETGNSTFNYQEGYQPTKIYPVIIVPHHQKYPNHHHRDKKRYHEKPYR